MNNRTWVKLSNLIGLVAIIALVYWVFGFIVIEAFDLRVFQKRTTAIFGMSIMCILALMAGALMINLMFNLTRIAEKHNQDAAPDAKSSAKRWIALVASFPLILVALFGGDYLSVQEKKAEMIAGIEAMLANQTQMAQLADYSFDAKWIETADEVMEQNRKSLDLDRGRYSSRYLLLITADTLNDARVFLSFPYWSDHSDDTDEKKAAAPLQKKNFIRGTTSEERAYLTEVFDHGSREIRFNTDGHEYVLFYPYSVNGKTIVLYFRDYERYGKLSS